MCENIFCVHVQVHALPMTISFFNENQNEKKLAIFFLEFLVALAGDQYQDQVADKLVPAAHRKSSQGI